MQNNKKNNNIKSSSSSKSNNDNLEVYDDQLGENASEEFKSEEYDNALQNSNKNKNMK